MPLAAARIDEVVSEKVPCSISPAPASYDSQVSHDAHLPFSVCSFN